MLRMIDKLLPLLADLTSLAGFLLTVYVTYTVKNIRSFYVSAAVIPKLISRITDLASDISTCYSKYDDSADEISLKLGLLDTNIKSLTSRLPRNKRGSLNQLSQMVRRYIGTSPEGLSWFNNLKNKDDNNGHDPSVHRTPELLWAIYGATQKILEEMNNFQEERKWQM
jgi:hypothetical protein